MTGRLMHDEEPHWLSPDDRVIHTTLEHQFRLPGTEHRWVYLWHWPIRAMHWVTVFCVLGLTLSGFAIGRPYFMTGGPAGGFNVQWVRLAHFGLAAVLVTTALVRFYWLFVGNRFERLGALFPVRPRDWVNLVRMTKYYLLIHPERAPRYLGHNPLQQFAYTFTYVVAGVMVLTGFVMYGQANPNGLIAHGFSWMAPLMGGMQMVRVIHHVLTWYFPIFLVIHLYLAIRADLLERSGTMSSMVSGGRFVPVEERYVDG